MQNSTRNLLNSTSGENLSSHEITSHNTQIPPEILPPHKIFLVLPHNLKLNFKAKLDFHAKPNVDCLTHLTYTKKIIFIINYV